MKIVVVSIDEIGAASDLAVHGLDGRRVDHRYCRLQILLQFGMYKNMLNPLLVWNQELIFSAFSIPFIAI